MDVWHLFCNYRILLFSFLQLFIIADAYDPLDPNANITITWDITSWTTDGYVATVTLYNYQMYRHIDSPGWRLGWTWAKKEVIWSMVGAQAVEQGDCSAYTSTIPHCCQKSPVIEDLLPGVPYSQQVANCCKGGVLAAYVLDQSKAMTSFQLSAGKSGNTNKTVRSPSNFVLQGPGPGYTCSSPTKATPSKFWSNDRRRQTQALLTWKVICQYSQFLASSGPTCCVSLSSFYNETIVPCPACTCSCMNRSTCATDNTSALLASSASQDLIKCTVHMCPVRIHWHIKLNYKEYWRVKVTATNFDFRKNLSDWSIVMQHPNFNGINTVFSFNYTSLDVYGNMNDSAMFWGIKFYNDMLMEAGAEGSVQSEILMKKDGSFTLKRGWAFPRRVYFNGDPCVLPPPDTYPALPNGLPALRVSKTFNFLVLAFTFLCSRISL